jgi:oxaloacetate decarboxylase alpha subunit
MTTPMMLPVAESFDRIGYAQVDLMGMIQFDVCVRYLKEDPWERIRLMRRRVRNTPLRAIIRSRGLLSFDQLSDDLVELFVERLAANGIRVIGSFDGLNDVDNMLVGIRAARRAGVYVYGALAYSHSPAHTDELFARTARALVERGGVDAVMIKDSGGLLTPQRVKTLIPALKAVIGTVPLEVHSHCLTGLARQVYVDAVELGADQVHLSIAPLADGPAQPAVQDVMRDLRERGYRVSLDDALIDEISAHFTEIAEVYGKPFGQTVGYDPFHYAHQVPGGMKTNFEFQLREAGMIGKLGEVLHECARIRAELGWPIMITPFSQLVGTQAVLNVVHGKRYAIVPDEVKKYALGYYGKLVAPVDPNVLDLIVENGSKRIPMTPSPMEPQVPGLRCTYPHADDDELLLRAMFLGTQVDAMISAGGRELQRRAVSPLESLREVLADRPSITAFCLSAEGANLEFAR